MIRLISATKQIESSGEPSDATDGLWITTEELDDLTGWRLKPEGLCKDDVCVPLGPDLSEKLVDGERVNAAGLWQALGRPVLHDEDGSNWVLGEAAEDRTRQLESLEAPDFSLPDIDGVLHSLSDYRGQKVLLATWASW